MVFEPEYAAQELDLLVKQPLSIILMMSLQHLLDAIRMCDLMDQQRAHAIAHHIAELLPGLDDKT